MAESTVTDRTPSAMEITKLASLAKDKGYNLHHCVPLTEATQQWWQIQRGFSMKFFATFNELAEHVRTVEPWVRVGRFIPETESPSLVLP